MTKKAEEKTGTSGRPPVLADTAVIFVDGRAARTILQSGSDRRAVINRIIDLGGRSTVEELNAAFGFDVRPRILSLMREGWLASTTKRRVALPRRTKAMLSA